MDQVIHNMNYSFRKYMNKKLDFRFDELNMIYSKIFDYDVLKKIYNLWFFNITFEPTCDVEFYHLGAYNIHVMNNRDIGIELLSKCTNNIDALYIINDFNLIGEFYRDDIIIAKHPFGNCNDLLKIKNKSKLLNCNISLLYLTGCSECGIEINHEESIRRVEKSIYSKLSYDLLSCLIKKIPSKYIEKDTGHGMLVGTREYAKLLVDYLTIGLKQMDPHSGIWEKTNKQYEEAIKSHLQIRDIILNNNYTEEEFIKACIPFIDELKKISNCASYFLLSSVYSGLIIRYNKALKYYNKVIDNMENCEKVHTNNVRRYVKRFHKHLDWKPMYHKYWSKEHNDIIMLLLLCLKNKDKSKYDHIGTLNKNMLCLIIDYCIR